MAVQYVQDFTFAPSPPRPTIKGYARGGHVKASTPQRYASGGLAKGSGVSNDSGHTGKNGPDAFKKRAQGDGNVKYYAKGGLAKGKGQSNDSGHSGDNGPDAKSAATRGQGDGDLKRSKVSPDIAASRTEKSSGVQSPAFKKGGHWIAGAIKHPGALHKEMGIPQGKKIPAAKLKAAAGKGGKLGQRARLAETLKGMHKSKGGSAKCYAEGGSVAAGKIPNKGRNPDDSVSPGSFKRTPPGQGEKNQAAARSQFSAEGRNTPVATKQEGSVQRMTGYSDFKKGGSAKFDRIKNLGHYAHGGKVKPSTTERAAGKAGSGAVKAPVKATNAGKAERAAGTPKTAAGSRVEMKSGTAKASMGGLSRGANPKKNAAIHAKSHKLKASGPGLAQLAGALSGAQMPHQSPVAGPGMAPGMGAPPGGPMGGMAPPPGVGGPAPAMSHGGVMHVVHHHQ